jgi:hypothetical protein
MNTSADSVPPVRTPDGDAAVAWHFRVFSVMWVIAGWFHLWNQVPWPKKLWWSPDPDQVVIELVLVTLGMLVLALPGRTWAFAGFLGVEALHGLLDAPRVANHWYLTMLVALVWVGSAASVWRRDGSLGAASWYRHAAPGARAVVWAGYSFAAFAKLNTDFLDPSVSCASTTWVLIGKETFHWMPQGRLWEVTAIWVTVFAELLIPVLLAWPGRRHWGVLIGLGFHYLISIPPQLHVPDFAWMLFSWWWLFLPTAVSARLLTRLGELAALFPALTRRRVLLALVPVAYVHLGWFAYGPDTDPLTNLLFGLRLTVFSLLGACWIVLLLLSWRDERGEVGDVGPAFAVRSPWQILLIVVVLFSGLSPYVGLRTRTNFTMFSNLRTEENRPNHLIMPQVYLTDHQLDLVEILASSSHRLDEVRDRKTRITWWELRYLAEQEPEASVTLRRDGEVVEIPRLGDHPDLSVPHGLLAKRLLSYRPVDVGEASTCQW